MACKNLLDNLLILNDTDRPCMHLVCRDINGKIRYVNEYLNRRYPRLRKGPGWASLVEYGFVFEDGVYKLKNRSTVHYFDGSVKKWQGRTSFTYQDIKDFNYFKESE